MSYRAICAVAVAFGLCMAGCSSGERLPVPPNVLRDGSGSKQLADLPPQAHRPDMTLFYVTDRSADGTDQRGERYGYKRSQAVTYGTASVSLGKDVTWDEIVAYSGSKSYSEKYTMTVTKVEKGGTFEPTIKRMKAMNGVLVLDEEGERREELAAHAVLAKALAQTPQKDVYVFVHGFANSFDDAVLRTAAMWHYVGRKGIAVAYTWPAGHGGMTGYFYDRESGEYTIYHLKRTLKIIAGCPSVERIHLIAHSRGTDVATTALRELNEEYRGGGKNPRVELKLQTLVLAAPDLDSDVFSQRFVCENLIGVADQIVVYGSKEDSAIALAKWLFGADRRVGSFDPAKAAPGVADMLEQLPSIQFVSTDVSGFSTSHAYVFSNPAAMSDLVLVLRDQKRAGAANGRPLGDEVGWWKLDDSYFRDRAQGK